MDDVNELGKNLKETKNNARRAIKQGSAEYGIGERARDIFDPVVSYSMAFRTKRNQSAVTANLQFEPKPPDIGLGGCCGDCFCYICESFDPLDLRLVLLSRPYVDGTVEVFIDGVPFTLTFYDSNDTKSEGTSNAEAGIVDLGECAMFATQNIVICYVYKYTDQCTTNGDVPPTETGGGTVIPPDQGGSGPPYDGGPSLITYVNFAQAAALIDSSIKVQFASSTVFINSPIKQMHGQAAANILRHDHYLQGYARSNIKSPRTHKTATAIASIHTNVIITPGNPSGQPMPNSNLNGWNLEYNDDFNVDHPEGTFFQNNPQYYAYPSNWVDSSKNGHYTPDSVSSVGGVLRQHIGTFNGRITVSAFEVPTYRGQFNSQYGRTSIRFRSDSLHGYKVAWLRWPQSNNWPPDGEIDFPEANLDGTIHAFMHRQGATVGSDQDGYSTNVAMSPAWHTATLEWLPNRCTFILDGTVIGNSTSRIPNTPMHWVIQTETNLDGYVPASDVQGYVYIDWLAAWSWAGAT